MGNTTLADWNKQGLVFKDGQLVQGKKLVSKKVEKLPDLLEQGRNNEVAEGKIFIKPLSVNDAFKGRRFKTAKYDVYCSAVTLLLPHNLIIPTGLLKVVYEFGLSSAGGDFDNPTKVFQDIIAVKYGFNDNRIMEATIKKVIVKKGHEYIFFRIESLTN